MRTEKSIKNSISALSLQIITIIFNFIDRTIFIKVLGLNFLGVNGLFGNLISLLSLAELGVGTAMVYSMYKPMAEENHKKIRTLMKLYARVYKIIGIVVIIIGCSLLPLLDSLMTNKPDVPYLNLYFIIFVLTSSSSYFFIYKASIFVVSQKEYIVNKNNMIFIILKFILQIIILILTGNYLIYLLVSLFTSIASNVRISYKADKNYPFIKGKEVEKLSREERKSILQNISALFLHRIGNVIVNGTDNLIISKMLGVTMVGMYSNYYLIIGAINSFTNIVYNAITASIGNLNATESKEKNYMVYKNVLFSNFWLGGFCAISLIILLNPFISLWIGKEYTLNILVVLVIVVNSYFTIIRKTTLVFRNAMGLFWKDRYKPLLESVINLVVSIFLTYKFGLIGVFLGTVVSTLTTSFWIEPWVLYKYGFNMKVRGYFKIFILYVTITIIAGILTWYLACLITGSSLVVFLYKIVICIIVPNLFFLICFYKKNEFKYFQSLLHSYLKK